jgi:hypothetical protein
MENTPHPMSKLTFDTILNILDYLPIEIACDSVLMKNMFPHIPPRELRFHRTNPIRLLSRLVWNPKDLLHTMLITDTILVGNWAVEYFLPGVADPMSEWEFYCSSDHYKAGFFMYWMTEVAGLSDVIKYDGESDHQSTPISNCVKYSGSSVRGHIKRKEGDCRNVYLLRDPSTISRPSVERILQLPSTMFQCYVSGYGAISANSYLTRMYTEVRCNSSFNVKYDDMCVNIYDEYYTAAHGEPNLKYMDMYSTVSCGRTGTVKLRFIGDKDSFCISYANRGYYDDCCNYQASILYRMCQLISWSIGDYNMIVSKPFREYHLSLSEAEYGVIGYCCESCKEFPMRMILMDALLLSNSPIDNADYHTSWRVRSWYNTGLRDLMYFATASKTGLKEYWSNEDIIKWLGEPNPSNAEHMSKSAEALESEEVLHIIEFS